MASIWRETAALPDFSPLSGDRTVEVLVVGGGLAGLFCAHRLTQAGADCALIEADTLCGGVSGNTTAKVTAQHGFCYDKLLRTLGEERARRYLAANLEAVDDLRALGRQVDCDWEDKTSYVYTLRGEERARRELAALARLGYPARWTRQTALPFPVAGAVAFDGQGQLHPLKLAAGLARGLKIWTHTRLLRVTGQGVETDRGRITARRVVIATHFPLLNGHGCYFLKLYQHRSYVVALEPGADVDGMYVDEAEGGLSFRNYGGRLLLGGGSHRTGKKGGGWRELETAAARYYPGARVVARWAAQDCMSLDGVPYVGRYGRRTPGLYVLSGFNKWGLTGAMAGAKALTGLLEGRESPAARLFSPARSMLCPQLAKNGLSSALGLLTPTVPRCPHMGCALRYNAQEHSWDCPCHGSRFDSETGKLLDNPAKRGKRRV